VENIQVDSPNDGVTLKLNTYSANSIYDPNWALGGHQPYGHDQFQLLYHHYEVTGATIKCTFTNGNTDRDGKGSAILGIRMGEGVGVFSSTDEITMLESPDVVYGVMAPGTGKLVLSNTFNQKAMFPAKHDGLTAAFGADPEEQAYFTIAVGSGQGGLIVPVDILVEIEYTCRFFEPKTLTHSMARP
jgi:hypothetical protein